MRLVMVALLVVLGIAHKAMPQATAYTKMAPGTPYST